MSPTPPSVGSPRQIPMEDDTNAVAQTVNIQNIFSFPADFDAKNFDFNFANGVPYGALPPTHPTAMSEGSQARLGAPKPSSSEDYPRTFLAQGVPIPHISLTGLSDSRRELLPNCSSSNPHPAGGSSSQPTASLPNILGPPPGATYAPVNKPPTQTGQEGSSLQRFDPYKNPLSGTQVTQNKEQLKQYIWQLQTELDTWEFQTKDI